MAQSLVWEAGCKGSLPAHAVSGGSNTDGEPLYVARIKLPSGLTPGKLATSYKIAHASHGGKEIYLPDYEVLTNPKQVELKWVPFDAKATAPPHGAVMGGNDTGTGDLYVARARRADGMLVSGKACYKYKVVYIPFGGKEEEFTSNCDVLLA